MTPTVSYLERYEHGDHAAVWDDLRTLGDQIRQPPLSADAVAVAHVLPRRWVVARTFAWLGRSRRLSKDYERLGATTEALISIALSRLMLRRLAGP